MFTERERLNKIFELQSLVDECADIAELCDDDNRVAELLDEIRENAIILCDNTPGCISFDEYVASIFGEADEPSDKLYHITKKENLDVILREGLKPCIGKNSAVANDCEKTIYLSNFYDLPYWRIMLDGDIILEISNINKNKLRSFNFSIYSEYTYDDIIAPENIRVLSAEEMSDCAPDDVYMHNLCREYTITICNIVLEFTRHYENASKNKNYKHPYFDEFVESYKSVLWLLQNRLDFSVVDKNNIRCELAGYADEGNYTFLDEYHYTGKKLYEQLICFPEPDEDIANCHKQLYDFITKTFDYCLDMNTGGWTG